MINSNKLLCNCKSGNQQQMLKTNFEVHIHSPLQLFFSGPLASPLASKYVIACTISLNFEIYFLEFQWEIVFGVITGNHFYLWFLENAKKTVIYSLKLYWYMVFVKLKLKLLDFQTDVILNSSFNI